MIRLVKGFRDILPGDVELWQHVEQTARELFDGFGFKEIRVPIMEKTELFARGIGADTDIVEKEMYTFTDRSGGSLTLRPEATAGIARAYIQHGCGKSDPALKWFTVGPMFRRERPQKGRFRQFYQINAEYFGEASPLADVQVIYLLWTLMGRLDVPDIFTHVNSLGCPECRPAYKEKLTLFIKGQEAELCDNCTRRATTNPLRVLDCKNPKCKEATVDAPSIGENLCEECDEHFDAVCKGLDSLGVAYKKDPRLVRGLDYYSRTTFEVLTGSLGAQNAVAGGGRYDGLVKILEGPKTPAIGFAIGFDRLVELLSAEKEKHLRRPDLFIACLGDAAHEAGFSCLCDLNAAGVRAEMDFTKKGLKGQMKRAGRLNARYVLILGDDELAKGRAPLRDMATREQEELDISALAGEVLQRVRNAEQTP